MAEVAVDVPQELLDQLARSGLAKVEEARRVRVALAIHLFLTDRVSGGRAAELAGYPLVDFYALSTHCSRSSGCPASATTSTSTNATGAPANGCASG